MVCVAFYTHTAGPCSECGEGKKWSTRELCECCRGAGEHDDEVWMEITHRRDAPVGVVQLLVLPGREWDQ